MIVIFCMSFSANIGIGGTHRYLSAKDGREASKAGWLAMALMAVGTVVWFMPPMIARFLYQDQVLAMDIENPATASYAFMAITLLPKGLLGIMIAAMFSATMSSMDTGLNGQTGSFMRNLVPRLRNAMGLPPLSDRRNLFWAKVVTVILGILVISYSLLMSSGGEIVLFDAYFIIGSVVGLPIAIPMLAALYIKRLPSWSYFFITGMCLIPSAWSLIQGHLYDNPWTIQDRSMWVLIFAAIGTLICMPFYRRSSAAYLKQSDAFFDRMRTPVDFEKEIGVTRDFDQLRLMGNTCLIAAGLLSCLFVMVRAWWEAGCVAFLVIFVVVIGVLLRVGASRERKRAEPPADSNPALEAVTPD
jgi:Na+/proline symporter